MLHCCADCAGGMLSVGHSFTPCELVLVQMKDIDNRTKWPWQRGKGRR